MKLSEFKKHLSVVKELNFLQHNGEFVPLHLHITEVGLITKNFLDCGGDVHTDKLANLQIWPPMMFTIDWNQMVCLKLSNCQIRF